MRSHQLKTEFQYRSLSPDPKLQDNNKVVVVHIQMLEEPLVDSDILEDHHPNVLEKKKKKKFQLMNEFKHFFFCFTSHSKHFFFC